MRYGDRAGRAGIDAASATSAVIFLRGVRRKLQRGQNLREKEPRPEFAVQQHRAFAMPADAGTRGVIALQHWPGVHITFLSTAAFAQKLSYHRQFLFDQSVV